MRVVLDTKVLVSGLLNPEGSPGRIVDLFLAGDLTVLVDDRILNQYRRVLPRPKFAFDPADVAELMEYLEAEAILVAARPLGIVLTDPSDLPFLEVAVAGGAESLVTGNERHFTPKRGGGLVRVDTPAEFIRRWKT